ncbi:MAG TPA: DNA alkylation repair protein [Acidobacteriota bacterium]|nr:DNA alkylation repair protein [Acidobacteriota bacterium]
MSLEQVRKALKQAADPVRAEGSRRYFKDPVGDTFLGVNTSQCRQIAKTFCDLPLTEVERLMRSGIHEERSLSHMILGERYRKGDLRQKKQIYDLLMKNRRTLQTWDAVDGTAPSIVGPHLLNRDKTILYKLARSRVLWDRRIAMVATLYFIRNNRTEDTFSIAEMLLEDEEDLIHKATGWMLREAGKKDLAALETFLKKHYSRLPRTSLRYAIERFPEKKRKAFLSGAF